MRSSSSHRDHDSSARRVYTDNGLALISERKASGLYATSEEAAEEEEEEAEAASLDSGVTSSFASKWPLFSIGFRCSQDSQPCLGHQEMFPGISRLSSCSNPGMDEDDEDEAEDGPVSARPPPRMHQLPPGSRLPVS
ncbi:uncharacterized protein LOC143357909 [Halictus rubicundus]|uniref:uncharacterized protein LOC143357909 n=1 Tax=Halictus rubicundus TaxID=77578 RepID=UPI00403579AE